MVSAQMSVCRAHAQPAGPAGGANGRPAHAQTGNANKLWYAGGRLVLGVTNSASYSHSPRQGC